jgi:basic amino acid/polyamine antiporter, APA family
MTAETNGIERLEKRLGLVDVYAICTGAMFASGFFLLPGVAAARAGSAVILAYAVSSLLMLPGLFSIAELSSAMPRAAGTYFFIHRSLGPLAGTIGGFGDWLTLTFKSAFALVGMGAYLAIFLDVPIQPVAVALTVAFGVLNILGAKETARLQVWLVATLLAIMTFYLVQGAFSLLDAETRTLAGDNLTPFFTTTSAGFVSTVALVFISYAGLTKVAAAAEEIRDLDRNLPLGMILALATIGVIYVGGVSLMVAFVDPETLHGDLTPVATAGDVFLDWLPGATGLVLVVLAAITAFASTGNAGILTASRYPLAMSRDRLTWSGFDRLGRFGTPTVGIIATCMLMIIAILFLDVERLASLGSAFLLFIFALVNLSVIIFRESRIESYVPGFRSPLYPWIQIVGIVSTLGLIASLGAFYVAFVLVIVVAATGWYHVYARSRTVRRGAIYGLFSRLGQLHDQGVDQELWGILQERGASDTDFFDEIVARAYVIDTDQATLDGVFRDVAAPLSERTTASRSELDQLFAQGVVDMVVPSSSHAAIYHLAVPDARHTEMALVRVRQGVDIDASRRFPGQAGTEEGDEVETTRVEALFVVVSPLRQATQHLRLVAQLASALEEDGFPTAWTRATGDQELIESILRDERFVSVEVGARGRTSAWVDQPLRDLDFPGDTLVALIRRGEASIIPHGDTVLQQGDRVTIVGTPADVSQLFEDGGA